MVMKPQTLHQGAKNSPQGPLEDRLGRAGPGEAFASQQQLDDLRERIAMRAYELYVQRGCRDGGSVEDWLDAEQEILQRAHESPAHGESPSGQYATD